MFRYFILFITINCILNLQSTISDDRVLGFKINSADTWIDILFSHNNQIRDDMMFAIIDSSISENINDKSVWSYGCLNVNHDEYKELLNEIKRIYCQKDSNETEGLFIEIDIWKQHNLI